jgi:hypothetical protein
MISEERAEKALRYLVDTDEPCALAKAEMERAEYGWKATREAVFTHAEGTVAERQAIAATHHATREAHERYCAAVALYSKMANKRETERIVLDTWRTISANRRMGSP